MTKESLIEAQEYLTMEKEEGFKRIVNITDLLKNHKQNEVINFLKEYLRDKEKALRNLILIDKTQSRVDQYVAAIFRIHMAIKTLEEGKEVAKLERFKQGAKESSQFHKRNSGSNRSSRKRQDQNHDGADRLPRYPSQRAA